MDTEIEVSGKGLSTKLKSAASTVTNSKAGLITIGILIGTLGMKILQSRPVRSAITHAAAGVMRVQEGILTAATSLREHTDDVLSDAKDINSERNAAGSGESEATTGDGDAE